MIKRYKSLIVISAIMAFAFLFALSDQYFMGVFILTCYYGALAVAWNLMAGITGLLSLGHALFVGIGAYTVAWGAVERGWPPFVSWPLGIMISIAAAYIIGALCFRSGLRGYFFAIATLAFGQVAFFVVCATDQLGRSDGIMLPMADNPELHLQFVEKWPYGLMIAAVLIGTLALGQTLLHNRTGYYWRALRDNEEAAQAIGVDARRFKMRALLISAGISALCGAFYANYVMFVDPRSVLGVDLSIQMLVFSIIGGMSQIWGPLLGATLLVPLSDMLRGITAIQGSDVLVYAVLLIALALMLPQGIAGWFMARRRHRKARQKREQSVVIIPEPAE